MSNNFPVNNRNQTKSKSHRYLVLSLITASITALAIYVLCKRPLPLLQLPSLKGHKILYGTLTGLFASFTIASLAAAISTNNRTKTNNFQDEDSKKIEWIQYNIGTSSKYLNISKDLKYLEDGKSACPIEVYEDMLIEGNDNTYNPPSVSEEDSDNGSSYNPPLAWIKYSIENKAKCIWINQTLKKVSNTDPNQT